MSPCNGLSFCRKYTRWRVASKGPEMVDDGAGGRRRPYPHQQHAQLSMAPPSHDVVSPTSLAFQRMPSGVTTERRRCSHAPHRRANHNSAIPPRSDGRGLGDGPEGSRDHFVDPRDELALTVPAGLDDFAISAIGHRLQRRGVVQGPSDLGIPEDPLRHRGPRGAAHRSSGPEPGRAPSGAPWPRTTAASGRYERYFPRGGPVVRRAPPRTSRRDGVRGTPGSGAQCRP